MVDGKQDIVCGSPNCYNGSGQLFQLNQLPHHREEAGTGVASSLKPQSQELLIDTSPRCLPLHTALTLREIIVATLSVQNNARHTEVGTEDGIEDSYQEGFQDGDRIAPSTKTVLMVSQKEERQINTIQRNEEVLIGADWEIKEQYALKENELILHHPSHTA